jgi:hypothetical protein
MQEEILKKSIKYYPEENEGYWKQHQSAFLGSGLSRKRYCREHGVNYDRFNYWFKKLSPHQEIEQPQKDSPMKKSLLLPVNLSQAKPDSPMTPLCTLDLKNGHNLVIHHERALSLLLEQWR